MKKYFILLLLLCTNYLVSNAQFSSKADTSLNIPIIRASYGVDIPGGDMAIRFGMNSELTFGIWYKTKKNFLIGVDASFIWSSNIRADSTILDGLFNSDESIIGDDGQYALYRLYERGYKLPVLKFGKMIPFRIKGSTANSGFFFLFGVGFMQHKIKIDDQSRTLVQVREDYYKGYDRLTNGLLLTQNVGYMYLGKKRRVNVFANLEFSEGFTKNRRTYNFDKKAVETKNRLDLLYGLKIGLAIPIYKKMATDFYYN